MDETEDRYPLSPLQQAMLDESLATVWRERVGLMQVVWELPEALDLAAFESAWQQAAARHPILRTRLVWRGHAQPLQEVVRQAAVPFAAVDCTLVPREEHEQRFSALLFADRQQGLDLERAPLIRVLAVRFAPDHHRVILTLHHTTFDGRTLLALVQEVFAYYEAARHGETLDLPPAGLYRTYIEWLACQDLGQAEAFWRQALRGARRPTSLGIARAARPPEPRREDTGPPAVWFSQDVIVWLSAESTAALMSFATGLGLTLNSLLLAAWSLLLSRYGGGGDVLFGVVRTHRGAVPGGPAILGPLMVSVPFPVAVDPASDLASWLQAVRGRWLAMRAADYATAAQIREWSELDPQAPLFESLVLFETHEITEHLRRQGPEWRHRSFQYLRSPRVPLSVYGYIEQRLQLKIIFDPALFDPASMWRLLGHLQNVMEAMPQGAGRTVAELPWLSAAERHQLLVDWNDTSNDDAWQPVHRRFEEQARRTPHALAVAGTGGSRTYREVEENANRLAHLLAARGAGPGAIVAVLLERSLAEVEVLLAVLKAGAAYLPLEGSAVERLDAILEDAGAAVLVTRSALRPVLRFPAGRLLELDRVAQELGRQPAAPPPAMPVPAELPAYVIYTSGSTGKPKGVVVPHRGLANLVSWHLQAFAVSAADRASRLAGQGFDASVWELWPYWSAGAAVLLPPEEVRTSPESLRDWLVETGVTLAFAPTPVAERLVELSWPREVPLRLLLTGGDTLHDAPPAGLPFTLINNYGPTENSVVATSGPVRPAGTEGGDGPPAIGRPIGNVRLRVLGPDLQPVPTGVSGELMIAGLGLAQSYLGRPELTAASFLPDPQGGAGERMYRTGDLVRFHPNGEVEFLGRKDSQVKLRGFRIEPGEIEAALNRHPAILGSAVVVREDERTDGKQLVAFLVGRSGSVTADDMNGFLRHKLPSYMIPAVFSWLESFPLSSSGKVDRKALEALAAGLSGHAHEHVEPRTPLERLLAQIWEDVLGCGTVGLQDDFFALGGSSLHVMRVLAVLQDLLHRDIPADLVFLSSTLERLIPALFTSEEERKAAERIAESMLGAEKGVPSAMAGRQ